MELDDNYFMRLALKEASRAFEDDEVPVGCVVVYNKQVIGKGYNQTQRLNDVTAHAEMIAITAAANTVNSKFLDECTLYVTLEPCVMCAGALQLARFHRIVFGASEPKTGFSKFLKEDFHNKAELVSGVLSDECAILMTDFFVKKRDK
jgi:tRNA(adenine34) deaminase